RPGDLPLPSGRLPFDPRGLEQCARRSELHDLVRESTNPPRGVARIDEYLRLGRDSSDIESAVIRQEHDTVLSSKETPREAHRREGCPVALHARDVWSVLDHLLPAL